MKRLRDERRNDVLHLCRVGDDARDDLADLRAREESQGKALQVCIDGVTHVARDVFLELRAEIPCQPDEEVLERDRDDDDEDHHLQRSHLVRRIEEQSDLLGTQPNLGEVEDQNHGHEPVGE